MTHANGRGGRRHRPANYEAGAAEFVEVEASAGGGCGYLSEKSG